MAVLKDINLLINIHGKGLKPIRKGACPQGTQFQQELAHEWAPADCALVDKLGFKSKLPRRDIY